MLRKIKPITPDEAGEELCRNIPEGVIEVWNELIARAFDGFKAVISFDDAQRAIASTWCALPTTVTARGWLSIEPLYHKAGWIVEFGKSQEHPASFIFRRRN